jgi:hypothetical protein
MSKGLKEDECRSRPFGIGPKEEEILIDHADGVNSQKPE